MKRLILAGLMISGLISTGDARHMGWRQSGAAVYAGFHGDVDVAFQTSLTPYGEWIDCNYGYVWRPYSVGVHWRPYMHGRWEWTDYGWYWVSYEPFGWATFHYGRWQYDDYYGWIWIPDDVWGPAWVEWRYDDNYIGWAPLTPAATFDISFGVTLSHGWVAPVHYWNFIPCRNFTAARVDEYVQPVEQTRRFFGSTRAVPNIRSEERRIVNRGVDPGFIERKSGSRIKRVDVVENNRVTGDRVVRGMNSERIEVYRPDLGRTRSGESGQPRVNEGTRRDNPDQQYRDRMREYKDERRITIPDNADIRRNAAPNIRQFRESEQRFEIPRNFEAERNRMRESFERRQNAGGRQERSFQQSQPSRPQVQPSRPQAPAPRPGVQAAPPARQNAPREQHAPPARSGRRP